MVAIAEAISESKHGGRRQLRRTSVCSAVNPRFCSFSRLFVVRCSLTVDEGQDPAGYPGAAAHCRGVGTGFRGADAEHNCGEHRSLPLNPGAAALSRAGRGTGFRGADVERKCTEHRSPPLTINGANTYQFVMSDPVDGTDPLGLWHWYEPWTWPIWHSTPAKVAVDTAKHVPPGGEFCEALGTLYGISKSDIARDAHHQLYHDLNNPNARYYGNPLNDPLYNGLSLWAGGDTGNMTPQEHQAVQNWINSHYASHK